MTGIELAVGYVSAWAVRKAKRVAGRADAEVDRTLDAAMDRLHGLVGDKLGDDPDLRRLVEEAGRGQAAPGGHAGRRVRLALEDAAESDPGFAEALAGAVRQVQALDRGVGVIATTGSVAAGDGGLAVGGNMDVRAGDGSVAAGHVGGVTIGNPPQPGPHGG